MVRDRRKVCKTVNSNERKDVCLGEYVMFGWIDYNC